MKYIEIFSLEELQGMSKRQIQNLVKYYGVDVTGLNGDDILEVLLLKINGKPDDPSTGGIGEDVQMSVRVKRAYGGS